MLETAEKTRWNPVEPRFFSSVSLLPHLTDSYGMFTDEHAIRVSQMRQQTNRGKSRGST